MTQKTRELLHWLNANGDAWLPTAGNHEGLRPALDAGLVVTMAKEGTGEPIIRITDAGRAALNGGTA